MTPRRPDLRNRSPVPEAEARCTGCGHRWWVGPGAVPAGEMPMCPECYCAGVATGRARVRRDDNTERQRRGAKR